MRACVAKIRELIGALDLTTTLSEQGIKEEDINWMAENCMKVSGVSIANHPVNFSLEEIKDIYRRAL